MNNILIKILLQHSLPPQCFKLFLANTSPSKEKSSTLFAMVFLTPPSPMKTLLPKLLKINYKIFISFCKTKKQGPENHDPRLPSCLQKPLLWLLEAFKQAGTTPSIFSWETSLQGTNLQVSTSGITAAWC